MMSLMRCLIITPIYKKTVAFVLFAYNLIETFFFKSMMFFFFFFLALRFLLLFYRYFIYYNEL
ncbi:hypothetical protein CANARDRAFT_150952 [[Candida] arabinofermentans NRRL YB-2248]|uniref:Uncharacterized protein n=1 Tax=[Candida] arabinofermentans NRRL YB-2248 TaxID=983967 RepID=A0A1E4T0T8_9ASCO|nr:hypothetical protein CANARDRAFT_150952 [[Candida] arabinofermentans NRRL YB-2248]